MLIRYDREKSNWAAVKTGKEDQGGLTSQGGTSRNLTHVNPHLDSCGSSDERLLSRPRLNHKSPSEHNGGCRGISQEGRGGGAPDTYHTSMPSAGASWPWPSAG